MNIYLFNVVFVLCIAVVSPFFQKLYLKKPKINIGIVLFSVLVFSILFFEMAFRGDFTTDIRTYHYTFSIANEKLMDFIKSDNFFDNKDILFQILKILIKQFEGTFLHFLVIIASIISFSYVKFVKNNSPIFWLSFLILFCSGSFYSGFNVMRQILVAALCSLCYQFIEKKEFLKYFVSIVFIAGFHLSTIIMIPAYFFLNIQWKKKNSLLMIAIVVAMTLSTYFFADDIIAVVTKFIYSEFSSDNAFGMSYGVGILSILKSIAMASGVLLNYKRFDMKNSKERLIYNGTILYLIFAVIGSKIYMIQRFTHFFIPCLMIGYPILLTKIQSPKNRQFATIVTVCFFIASGINVMIDGVYYFYWENQMLNW